jgi:hypothetical protein
MGMHCETLSEEFLKTKRNYGKKKHEKKTVSGKIQRSKA